MPRTLVSARHALSTSDPERPPPHTIAFFDLETTGVRLDRPAGQLRRRQAEAGRAGRNRACCISFSIRNANARPPPPGSTATAQRELALQDAVRRLRRAAAPLVRRRRPRGRQRRFRASFSAATRSRAPGSPASTGKSQCALWSHRPRGERAGRRSKAIATRRRASCAAYADMARCATPGPACRRSSGCRGLPWRLDFGLCGDPTPANYRAPALPLPRLRAALARPADAARREWHASWRREISPPPACAAVCRRRPGAGGAARRRFDNFATRV